MSGTLAQRVARAAAARRRRLVWRGVETALLLAALLVILFPILWMALTAFKRLQQRHEFEGLKLTPMTRQSGNGHAVASKV